MMITNDRSQTLNVTTCDKCGKIMLPDDKAIFVAHGKIGKFDEYYEELNFNIETISYACHASCWDNCEDGYEDIEDLLQ